MEFAAEKRADVVGFDGVDGGSREVVVNGSQICLSFEDRVGGVLGLVNTPMIGESKMLEDGTEAAGKLVQFPMKTSRLPAVGNRLSAFPIVDLDEGVVQQLVADPLALQLQRQPVMAIAVDLQPARQPCRYPDVTKPQFFIDEIEVVVQTLTCLDRV